MSSLGHYIIKATDLDYSFSKLKNSYDSLKAYGLSKLAQIYHASELTRRYGIKAYALHPGILMSTGFNRNKPIIGRISLQLMAIIGKTTEQGAMTSFFCALSDDAVPGCFHSNCRATKPSSLALDAHRAEECWKESERLINEKVK